MTPAGCTARALLTATGISRAVRSAMSWLAWRVMAATETSSVAASVRPMPSSLLSDTPRSAASLRIWARAPKTSTTSMLSDCRTATSCSRLLKPGWCSRAPSMAMTKTRWRNCGT
jgi:hypothetical protein